MQVVWVKSVGTCAVSMLASASAAVLGASADSARNDGATTASMKASCRRKVRSSDRLQMRQRLGQPHPSNCRYAIPAMPLAVRLR